MLERKGLETKLSKLGSQATENVIKRDSAPNNQVTSFDFDNFYDYLLLLWVNHAESWRTIKAMQKLREELKLRTDELHEEEESLKRMSNEKSLLEQKIFRLEKKKSDEVMHFVVKLQRLYLLLLCCK